MKIVFDSLVFALHKYGGVTTYWNEFINRFRSDRADLSILTVPDSKYLNPEFIALQKSTVHKMPERNWPLQVLRNTSPRITAIAEKFIFHSTYLRVCNNGNALNVVTIHDFTHQYFVKGFKERLNYYQKKNAIGNSDGIVCISENTRNDLYKFFPEARTKKVRVIYNGCSQVYMDQTKVEPISGLAGRYILFVGARDGYKNFDFVLQLLKSSEYNLVVVGSEFTDREAQLVSQFKDRIVIFKNADDSKLKALYQHAHAFIYPSLYEGFGIPLLEAMNCGCPVIAFQNSCIGEIMGSSPLLLRDNDLKSALDCLVKLEVLPYRETIVSEQYVQAQKFSWDRAYQQMKTFYEELSQSAQS